MALEKTTREDDFDDAFFSSSSEPTHGGFNGAPIFVKREGRMIAFSLHLGTFSTNEMSNVIFDQYFLQKIRSWEKEMRPSIRYCDLSSESRFPSLQLENWEQRDMLLDELFKKLNEKEQEIQ